MPYKDKNSIKAKNSSKLRRKRYYSSLKGRFAYRYFAAKERCNNSNNPNYRFYKNIKFNFKSLEEFKTILWDSFVEHVNTYGIKNTTLDRIDTFGDYEPGNCRWATRQVQSKNRKDTILITYNEKTQCLSDWAKETGILRSTLYNRIFKFKWNLSKVFSITPRIGFNQFSIR